LKIAPIRCLGVSLTFKVRDNLTLDGGFAYGQDDSFHAMDYINLKVDLFGVHLLLEEVKSVKAGSFDHFCLCSMLTDKSEIRRVRFKTSILADLN